MQNNFFDPKEKNKEEGDEPLEQSQEGDESVYLVNNDGTPFDNSERTYVSVDLPEEETDKDS